MLCRNEIAVKDADRNMIALAMEQYLAGGHEVHVGEPCKMSGGMKQGVLNGPLKQKKAPKAKPAREPKPVKSRVEATKKAVETRIETFKRRREIMAVVVAAQAALGDSLTAIAADLRVSSNLIRRIAKENNIIFTAGLKAQ